VIAAEEGTAADPRGRVRAMAWAYGIATLSVLGAALAIVLMHAQWQQSVPLGLFLLAIIFSAWFGGPRAGVLALVLSVFSYVYLFLASPPALHAIRILILSAVAGYVVWLTSTERAKARKLAQASDALRLAVDTIPAMVWSLSPEGKLEFLNRRWLEYSGLSLDEALQDPTGTMHPDDVAQAVDQWAKNMAGGQPYEGEMRLRRADGAYRWFLVRTTPLRDDKGNILKWYGTSTDIEERKRAEEAVRENRQLLEFVLQTLPVGVAVMDTAGDIILANAASQRIWEGSIVQRKERLARSKGYWHDSGRQLTTEEWASVIAVAQGTAVLEQLIDIEAYDASRKTIKNSAAPIRNAQGAIVGAVVVNEDVTDRVHAEKASRESADRLQHLSRRLLAVQESERRHLSRELHDEFGQLLSAISLHLQVAKSVAGEAAWPSLQECAALVERAGQGVRSMALDLRPAMLETAAGLDGTLRWLAEQQGRQSGIAILVSGHLDDVPSEVGVTCFRVVQEALTNVIRHAQAREVHIELEQTADAVKVVIEDDGIGFDVATTRVQAATLGHLGLVGMQERVDILGGELHIESRPQSGTRLAISLPLAARQ